MGERKLIVAATILWFIAQSAILAMKLYFGCNVSWWVILLPTITYALGWLVNGIISACEYFNFKRMCRDYANNNDLKDK